MPNDIASMVTAAKGTLKNANTAFPSPKPAVAPKAAATPASKPTVGDELRAKSDNVNQYLKSVPAMHSGGPVMADGAYRLKAGEHVLTAPEASKARKHALMASGMKSLAKPSDKVKMAHAKSTLETASKFKATKPAPSYQAPPDSKPGTVDKKSVAKLNVVSERARRSTNEVK